MEEKEILLKTIEGLNASISSLSTTNKNQSEQIKNLQERIKELTAQVAWLNRQSRQTQAGNALRQGDHPSQICSQG